MKQSYIAPITHTMNPYMVPQYYPSVPTPMPAQYQTVPTQMPQSRYIQYPQYPMYQAPLPPPPYQNYSPPKQSVYYKSEPSSLQNSFIRNPSNKWNINQNNQANLNNFPFGRDRADMYRHVTDQMDISIDEENKRILEKFRIDAIKNRNQRVMKHLGKIPYISESMMPGSIDAEKLVQKQTLKTYIKPIPMKSILPQPQYVYVPTIQVQVPVEEQKVYPIIKTPRKLTKNSSIGVQVNFEQQFPLGRKKKKRNQPRYYTIQQQQEEQAMNKIEDMLHQINVKLKKNSQLLSKSTVDNMSLVESRIVPQNEQQKKSTFSRLHYFRQNTHENPSKLPSIKYSGSYAPQKTRSKTLSNEGASSSLKDHLKYIKKNRRRIQDLDDYVYS